MAQYREDAPEFAIRDRVLQIAWADGTVEALPLRVARMMYARFGQTLAEFDHSVAEVVPIRSNPRKGKARA